MSGLVLLVYYRRNLIFSISIFTPLTFLCFIFNLSNYYHTQLFFCY